MTEPYDCIVVGARCAGSPLAHFLARAGKRVLLVDSASFPSDQPMSTHFIQPYGMRVLDELGLAERVYAIAPPVHLFINAIGEHVLELEFPPGIAGACPRRTDLDAILLEGARAAGAEVRLRCRVVDVIREGDRVCGVIVDEDGAKSELRGRVVVGADGRNSTIAELVGAPEYYAYDGPRAAYWAYWPRLAEYATAPRYRGGALVLHDPTYARFAFPVNRDQMIVGVTLPRDELATWKADPTKRLLEVLGAHALTAPLVTEPPLSKALGLIKPRYFLRQATGPGWALVGDAGMFKDPTPGLGITDAFRDARALARAIVEGSDAALERYWRERDTASLELFHFAKDLGALDYDNALNRVVFARCIADPRFHQRFIDVIDRKLSPYDAFSAGEIVKWTLGALVRGNFGVLGRFFRAGKVRGYVKKELKARTKLVPKQLAAASA